jgi:PST family polysaccharide transporter
VTKIRTNLSSIATGAATLSLVNAFRLLLQTLSLPLMARLLSPDDYGLAAMAMPLVLFVMMLADGGLASSLVRHGSPDGAAWHSCFWMSCGLGAALSGLIALSAPLAGAVLNEPRVVPVIAVLGTIVLGQAASLVPGAALQQARRFGTIALLESFVLVLALGTAVICAIKGLGVWALIWQQIVLYGVRVVLNLCLSPYRVRFVFRLQTIREHAIFGGNLIGVSLVTLASRAIDNVVMGRVCGTAPVGLFAMALQFSRLPFMLATGPLQYVIYPHISDPEQFEGRLGELFLLMSRLLAIVILPGIGLLAVASGPIFHILLSAKWDPAIRVFATLAAGSAVQTVTALAGTFVMALGRTDLQLKLAVTSAVGWFLCLIGSVWWGIDGVALANSLWTILFALWSLHVVLPLIGCRMSAYLRAMLWPAGLSGIAMALYLLLEPEGDAHDLAESLLAAGLAAATIGITLFIQRADLLKTLKRFSALGGADSAGRAVST